MNKQINYWKLATCILGTLFLMIIIVEIKTIQQIKNTPEEMYSLGKFDIPQKDFYAFLELNKDKTSFPICSIEAKDCLIINKIPQEESVGS